MNLKPVPHILFLFFCLSALSGCGINFARDISPVTRKKANVSIKVTPLTDSREVKKLLKYDLIKKHILPIQIEICNYDDVTIRLSSTQVCLEYFGMDSLSVLSQKEMIDRTSKNYSAPMIITICTLGYGFPLSALVGTDIDEHNLDIRTLKGQKAIKTITLDSNEQMTGLFFFDIPDDVIKRKNDNQPVYFRLKRLTKSSGEVVEYSIPFVLF